MNEDEHVKNGEVHIGWMRHLGLADRPGEKGLKRLADGDISAKAEVELSKRMLRFKY
jgi:hypothetical protein